MGKPSSLVLVTVDCLRSDHVGFLGYQRPTTPFLDLLARESFVFHNAIVAGVPTYYSFPAIMASRYPLGLGREVVGLAPEEPTLASVLNGFGYATAAFVANNPHLLPCFGYDAGFETFSDFGDKVADHYIAGKTGSRSRLNRFLSSMCHKLGFTGAVYEELYFQYCQRIAARPVLSVDPLRPYLPADQVVDHARDWLRTVGEGPFFIWLHLMDAHSPYYPPEQALAWMGQYDFKASRALYANSYWRRDDLKANRLRRIREEVVWLYDAGIRWVDAQISRLVETLTALGQWENCIFAFTADHGEEFLDHGGRFRPPRVNEELVHVPFFLRLPNIREGRPVVSPFSLLHLAPTLLDALDLPFPAEFRGRSFWPQLCDGGGWNEPAIVECVTTCTNPWQVETRFGPRVLAVRELRYKLVLDFRSSSEQLFDLDADPQELHPLPATREAAMRGRLLERARKHLVTSLQGRDPDVRLKALLRNLRLRLTE